MRLTRTVQILHEHWQLLQWSFTGERDSESSSRASAMRVKGKSYQFDRVRPSPISLHPREWGISRSVNISRGKQTPNQMNIYLSRCLRLVRAGYIFKHDLSVSVVGFFCSRWRIRSRVSGFPAEGKLSIKWLQKWINSNLTNQYKREAMITLMESVSYLMCKMAYAKSKSGHEIITNC